MLVAKDPVLTIKFDGGDASRHAVDMRLLGRSMMGFDRIISDGTIFMMTQRLPRRGERARLIVKAQQPYVGTVSIFTTIQEVFGVLGLGWPLFTETQGQNIWEWVKFVLEYCSGNKKGAENSLNAIMQMNRENLLARDRSEARMISLLEKQTDEVGRARTEMYRLADRLVVPAIHASAPIGPSARSVELFTETSPRLIVDEPMADAIRAKGELEVSDLMLMSVTADGWIYHSRILNVRHPEAPGRFLSAKVRDPLGEVDGNVYADAARDKATIMVKAKIARRGQSIECIYIMDYVERVDAPG
jgi:hypothetical protein